MVARRELPGTKVGRRWIFIEQDLVMHLRNNYSIADASQGDHYRSNKKWHSKEKTVFGGSTSLTLEKEYEKVLKLR
ncbi:DNA-binding protein [Legionella pneumophila]|nr:DNA-binding protein [Legionella pneumophila]